MKNSKVILLALAASVVLGGTYFFLKKGKVEEPEPANLVEIQRQIEAKQTALMGSETAKTFEKKDFVKIREEVLTPKNESEREKFFETTIHLVDRNRLANYKAEEIDEIYKTTLDFVTQKREEFKGRGARSATLAARLLKKLPQPKEGSENYRRTLAFLKEGANPQLSLLILEVLSGWKPFPKDGAGALREQFSAKDASVVANAIQVVNMMADNENRKAFVREIGKKYPQMPSQVQPLALKTLILHSHLLEHKLDQQVEYALRQKSDNWLDVGLFGVERLNLVQEFEGELREVRQRTRDQVLMDRAENLLKRSSGGNP